MITEKKDLMSKYMLDIEQKLFPLYDYLKIQKKFEFQSNIFSQINSFLKFSKQITPIMKEIFINFTTIFEKNECNFEGLFEILNFYISYGEKFILSDTRYLEIVFYYYFKYY